MSTSIDKLQLYTNLYSKKLRRLYIRTLAKHWNGGIFMQGQCKSLLEFFTGLLINTVDKLKVSHNSLTILYHTQYPIHRLRASSSVSCSVTAWPIWFTWNPPTSLRANILWPPTPCLPFVPHPHLPEHQKSKGLQKCKEPYAKSGLC